MTRPFRFRAIPFLEKTTASLRRLGQNRRVHSEKRQSTEEKPYAIIVSGDSSGVGAVRCLTEEKIPVACADWQWTPALFSLKVRRKLKLPDPAANESHFIQALVVFGKRFRSRPVIFPCTDGSVWPIAKYSGILKEYFCIPLSKFDLLERVLRKEKLHDFLEQKGYPSPQTIHVPPSNDLPTEISRAQFPCIVKPSLSHVFARLFRTKAFLVRNVDELKVALSLVRRFDLSVCIQEFIPSDSRSIVSACGYFDRNSDPLAITTTRREREWPLRFGTTCRVRTERLPEVLRLACGIVRDLRFHGIADLDFIEDARNGTLKLIDFNPRCWVEIYASARAGQNIPLAAYNDALGIPVSVSSQKDGIEWVNSTADIPAAFSLWRKGGISSASLAKQYFPPVIHSTMSASDLPLSASKAIIALRRLLEYVADRGSSLRGVQN